MHERTDCTNVDSKGRDCDLLVAPDSPVSMCAEHIEMAALHFLDQAPPVPNVYGDAVARLELLTSLALQDRVKVPAAIAVAREKLAPPRDEREYVVYYLQFGDRVKIGTTTRLAERLVSIPHDRLLAVEPGGYDTEALRHEEFDDLRLRARGHTHNEWFTADERLLSHCLMLRQHFPQPDVRDRRFKLPAPVTVTHRAAELDPARVE